MYYYTNDNYEYQTKPKRTNILITAVLLIASAITGAFFSYLLFKASEPERVPGSVIQKTIVNYQVTDDAEVIIAKNNLFSVVSIETRGGNALYSGTGFIVDYVNKEDALNPIIMTNYHVISPAVEDKFSGYKIYIKLFDKADFFKTTAQVIGYDSEIDIAVLRLDVDLQDADKRVVEFGNSRLLQYGQRVVAIGNALGGGLSVTAGEISIPEVVQELTLSQKTGAHGTTQHLIQTSAAINSGNSGGILLNMSGNGQVIGINTYKATAETVSLGLGESVEIPADNVGLAVPSNMAVAVLDYIRDNSENYSKRVNDIASVRKSFEFNLKNVSAAMDNDYNNVLKISSSFFDLRLRNKIITKINGVDVNDFHKGIYTPSASIFQELSLYYGNKETDLSDHPFYNLQLTLLEGKEEVTYTIYGLYLQREIPWLDELIDIT